MTIELWDRILNVNLKGVIYGTQEAYQQMVAQKHGHIVNVSSLAGLIPGWMQVAYSTTKWAVLGLTKSLRPEAAAYGIKVTAVCPGIVDTNIFKSTTLLNVSREDFIKQIPFKPIPAQKAAKIIVEGMLSNQAEVVFPFHAKALKNFYRFLPGTFNWMGKKEADKFRKLIKTQQVQPT